MSPSTLSAGGGSHEIFRIEDAERLPYTLRILLENALRHGEEADAEALRRWQPEAEPSEEISFRPARVLLQDFTGVPAVVDLAAMRNAMADLGGDPTQINPQLPAELVIDHSVQVDEYATARAMFRNAELEFQRNRERYAFLRWGQTAFDNFKVVPPNTGIVHQVNLEFLARVIETRDGRAFPDTLVGTDSHTTMVNGLGVLGWGVGGIEAEAAMLGEAVSMLMPQVVGFRLTGSLPEGATATDLVLTVTQQLRKAGVVGKFVEYFGHGLVGLPLADRATIGNMSPEYGATCGFFPVDDETLKYLRLTGRDEQHVALVEAYCKENALWHDPNHQPEYSQVLELDLSQVEPSLAGPRRPQDRVPLRDAKESFLGELDSFGVDYGNGQDEAMAESFPASDPPTTVDPGHVAPLRVSQIEVSAVAVAERPGPVTAELDGEQFELDHGSVVIAAITSCTNTSNPQVMIGAGLMAKKAVERGLRRKPWVKSSLAPGSKVVTEYYDQAGLTKYLDELGFQTVGYGCTTCIGNSGPLPEPISKAVVESDLVVCSVLSGNRNFEARIHPEVKANYLASPMLVVAYALAGGWTSTSSASRWGRTGTETTSTCAISGRPRRRFRRRSRAPSAGRCSPGPTPTSSPEIPRGASSDPRGRPLRLGSGVDVRAAAAVLRGDVTGARGRRGRPRRALPRRARRLGDDGSHFSGRVDQARTLPPGSTWWSTVSNGRTSTRTGRGAATTR